MAISCADDTDAGHARVLIEGDAEIVEGPVPMAGRFLEIAREMTFRHGGEGGLEYLAGTINKPRYLLRVTPRKITSWSGGWHPRYGKHSLRPPWRRDGTDGALHGPCDTLSYALRSSQCHAE